MRIWAKERIVDLVRHACGQPAHAGELFFFSKLRRQQFTFVHGHRHGIVTLEQVVELPALPINQFSGNGRHAALAALREISGEDADRLQHAPHE